MGYESANITIYISLDRHGGEKQERDDKLYRELLAEIRKLIEQEKFKHLVVDTI